MNKALLAILTLCVVGVCSRPQNAKEPIAIVLQENNASVDGSFSYRYESADGTKENREGRLKDAVDEEGKPAKAEEITGQISYQGEDGQAYSITYVADENGYRPEGAHLPTPPPIPEAIQRSLDFIATKKPDA